MVGSPGFEPVPRSDTSFVRARARNGRRPSQGEATHAAGRGYQLSMPPLSRHNFPVTSPALLRGLQAKTKKAFRGIALEGLVLNEYRSLGRFPPLGVAEQAHTTGGALEAGHESLIDVA